MEGEIPELLKPISWLVGAWASNDGAGEFPTIKDFAYKDVIEFRFCGKQPLLAYSGSSSHPEKGNPMHLESGFLRSRGEGSLSFMVAHNFGVTSLEEGTVTDKEIVLNTINVTRMTGSKDPSVLKIERKLKLVDDKLIVELSMATSTTPTLTHHLRASYTKKM